MENFELEELVLDLIKTKREDDWWDFKERHYEDNASLLHDILCMANNRADRDAYIILGVKDKTYDIVGVENDANRKNQQNIVDFLRKIDFAGQVRPRVEVQTIELKGHDIDVIIIKNTRDVPYYIVEDYSDKKHNGKLGKTVRAAYIYTRVVDNNTAIDKTADINEVEYLWKKRFGLIQSPIDRFQILIEDKNNWDINEEETRYYKLAPEFTIVEEVDEHRDGYEFYLFNQTDNRPHWYNIKLFYHSTLICVVGGAALDGGRCFTSTAKTEFLNLKMHEDVSYRYFVKGSLDYALHNFYITSLSEYSEQTFARNRYLECVLVFESMEEKERFNVFARHNYNSFKKEKIKEIQKKLPSFQEIKGYHMDGFKHQYEDAMILQELLKQFRVAKIKKV